MRELSRNWKVLLAVASGFLGVGYLGVDIMGWEHPWAFWLGLSILIIGVLIAGAVSCYAYVLWKQQPKVGISDETIRAMLGDIRGQQALDITKTLRLMHKQLFTSVLSAVEKGLDGQQMLKVYCDMEELLGLKAGVIEAKVKKEIEKRKVIDTHAFRIVNKLARKKVLKLIRPRKLFTDKTQGFMADLVEIMNQGKVGIEQVKRQDKRYNSLENKLNRDRDSITSLRCVNAIDSYLSMSDKLNNIILFTFHGMANAENTIPLWARMNIRKQREAYNRLMNLLLVDVGVLLERWRLGKDDNNN